MLTSYFCVRQSIDQSINQSKVAHLDTSDLTEMSIGHVGPMEKVDTLPGASFRGAGVYGPPFQRFMILIFFCKSFL